MNGMSNEVEVKILDIDRKTLESGMRSLGARKVFDGEMYAVYLDYADDELKKKGDLLRLRQEGTTCVLTFKEFVSDETAKIRKECEVNITDFKSMRYIFEQLGFKEWLIVRKHRTSYEIDGVHFEFDKHLDDHAYIPEFLEIEAADLESIYRFVEMLGFKKDDCRPWTFLDVADHYVNSK
jgi:predicted adenylyl cyclase CyaB